MDIKDRIALEALKNANKQEQKFFNLITALNENKITDKECAKQLKKISPKDVNGVHKLIQETTTKIIISELEELKKRVAKIE